MARRGSTRIVWSMGVLLLAGALVPRGAYADQVLDLTDGYCDTVGAQIVLHCSYSNGDGSCQRVLTPGYSTTGASCDGTNVCVSDGSDPFYDTCAQKLTVSDDCASVKTDPASRNFGLCPVAGFGACSPAPDCSGGTNPYGGGSFGCYPDLVNCDCECSPIVLDVEGRGFRFTNVDGGVSFDLRGDGVKKQMAWTTPGSKDAFLALDRNGNGTIDDGTELFGNFTPQPTSSHRNGFLALAQYDKPGNGGNGDGVIDRRDKIWPSLLLWIDENHNGISEPQELHSLDSMGIEAIDLSYKEDRRRDRFGNSFKYRARIHNVKGDDAGRWAYDVFLLIQP